MSIFVHARFDARDGRAAEFEEVVLALRDRARAEPGTLTYRVFAAGAGAYVVLEEYADTAAAIAHNEGVADLLERVAGCADLVQAELYGPIGPELAEWVRSRPQVTAYPDLPAVAES